MGAANLLRVTKQDRCPVCGHPDWCYWLDADTIVCMRVPSETPKKSRCGFGGYVHHLNGVKRSVCVTAVAGNVTAAPLDVRHRVYKELLSLPEMSLTVQDYRQFSEWGIAVETVKSRGYRRLPLYGRARICRELLDRGCTLEGVPGFYVHDKGYWTFTTGPGLIFPCLAPDGKIQGLQVRLDNPGEGHKYVWFSSNGRPGGASSGAPWHLAKPTVLKNRLIVITEGFKKADVIAEHMGIPVIGVAGVGNWHGVPEYVERLNIPVVVAYDMDMFRKVEVYEAFRSLISSLKGVVYVAAWDPRYKGLDDLLVSGGRPRFIPVNKFFLENVNHYSKINRYGKIGVKRR